MTGPFRTSSHLFLACAVVRKAAAQGSDKKKTADEMRVEAFLARQMEPGAKGEAGAQILWGQKQEGLDVKKIIVVDCSGSMAGKRLESVHRELIKLLDMKGEKPIVYSFGRGEEEAERVTGQELSELVIHSLQAGGGTQGNHLLRALKAAAESHLPFEAYIISDGEIYGDWLRKLQCMVLSNELRQLRELKLVFPAGLDDNAKSDSFKAVSNIVSATASHQVIKFKTLNIGVLNPITRSPDLVLLNDLTGPPVCEYALSPPAPPTYRVIGGGALAVPAGMTPQHAAALIAQSLPEDGLLQTLATNFMTTVCTMPEVLIAKDSHYAWLYEMFKSLYRALDKAAMTGGGDSKLRDFIGQTVIEALSQVRASDDRLKQFLADGQGTRVNAELYRKLLFFSQCCIVIVGKQEVVPTETLCDGSGKSLELFLGARFGQQPVGQQLVGQQPVKIEKAPSTAALCEEDGASWRGCPVPCRKLCQLAGESYPDMCAQALSFMLPGKCMSGFPLLLAACLLLTREDWLVPKELRNMAEHAVVGRMHWVWATLGWHEPTQTFRELPPWYALMPADALARCLTLYGAAMDSATGAQREMLRHLLMARKLMRLKRVLDGLRLQAEGTTLTMGGGVGDAPRVGDVVLMRGGYEGEVNPSVPNVGVVLRERERHGGHWLLVVAHVFGEGKKTYTFKLKTCREHVSVILPGADVPPDACGGVLSWLQGLLPGVVSPSQSLEENEAAVKQALRLSHMGGMAVTRVQVEVPLSALPDVCPPAVLELAKRVPKGWNFDALSSALASLRGAGFQDLQMPEPAPAAAAYTTTLAGARATVSRAALSKLAEDVRAAFGAELFSPPPASESSTHFDCPVCLEPKRAHNITAALCPNGHRMCTPCKDAMDAAAPVFERSKAVDLACCRCCMCRVALLPAALPKRVPPSVRAAISDRVVSVTEAYTMCAKCDALVPASRGACNADATDAGSAGPAALCAQCTPLTVRQVEDRVVECPRCQKRIQHAGGCWHMECTCGHHFCLACGDSFVDRVDSNGKSIYGEGGHISLREAYQCNVTRT